MATYYVSKQGKNSNPGTKDKPFLSLEKAHNIIKAGDKVVVDKGQYDHFNITKPNTTWESKGAIIDLNGANKVGILILANGVTVDGWEVRESGLSGIVAQNVHHVTITNNYTHHNIKYGIFAGEVDFITIIGNESSYNAAGGSHSGISVHPKDHGFDVGGYHANISHNIVHHNEQKNNKNHTDGFGIIWDNNPELPYKWSVLISGNLVHSNGHEGILIFNGDKIFLRSNILYHNGQDDTIPKARLGELETRDSTVYAVNNKIVAPEGHKSVVLLGSEKGHDFDWKKNHLYVENSPGVSGVYTHGVAKEVPLPTDNFIGVDPGFSGAPSWDWF